MFSIMKKRNEIGRSSSKRGYEAVGIRNKTQKKTWMRRYRKGEVHRLKQ
ncbi:hypothetical protein C1A50_2248 [Paenibacillus polymyxa]|nr:hypothetical protein C1A50_2248 [Paenibacillus polymyxa]